MADLLVVETNERVFKPEDLDACLAIFDSNAPSFILPHEKRAFVSFLMNLPHSGYFLVFEDKDKKIVACGGFAILPGHEASLCYGMVDKEYHGAGVGKQMRDAREKVLAGIVSLKKIKMDTSQHNVEFFKNRGFEVSKLTPNGYAPGLHRYDLVKNL